ncbi:MAG: hypothetical protein ACLSVY_10635, partial [Ruminococcus callidus]
LTKNLTTHLSYNLCAVLPFSTGQENDLLSCFCFISSCENFVEMLDKYRGVCYNIKGNTAGRLHAKPSGGLCAVFPLSMTTGDLLLLTERNGFTKG